MKTGAIVRLDDSGLGNQTRAIARLIRPDRIMAIDSRPFRGVDTPQHLNWYEGYSGAVVNGFPGNRQVMEWLLGLDQIVTCETTYNPSLYALARARNVRTINQVNPEFFDGWISREQVPDVIVLPSRWKEEQIKAAFLGCRAIYAPPPLIESDFQDVRGANFARHGIRTFVHPVGRLAANDRAGTIDLLHALAHSNAEFKLVIRSQFDLPAEYQSTDPRVSYEVGNVAQSADLFREADVVLHPRKYGGLNMIANEGLMCGLPVVMTHCSPNDDVLPDRWLVAAVKTGSYMTRRPIDLYQADPVSLAAKIDEFCDMSDAELLQEKQAAYSLAMKNYSVEAVKPRWEEVLAQ